MADALFDLHQKWINHLQPEGLVVASQVLTEQQVGMPRDLVQRQSELRDHLDADQRIASLSDFLTGFLNWPARQLRTGADLPEDLVKPLDAFGDELRPTCALQIPTHLAESRDCPWILIREEPAGIDLDKTSTASGWQASPHARLERLLRETCCPVGLLSNGSSLRFLYAPRGESAGHLTFPIAPLVTVPGRAMLSGLLILLDDPRIRSASPKARLLPLLKASREAQARVSAELSQQVLASLYELLRGFAQADRHDANHALAALIQQNPQDVYQGLLTVLLRLVFLLYAEDRGVLPQSDLYQSGYSVHGLWARLRDDHARYPDTMDQRFGAWARLLALFSLVHQGSRHPDLQLPARHGHLFDPARFPFLGAPGHVPLVPDGTIHRILENLLILKGERLSYRTLDVEQIGSVYEAIMGFSLVTVSGTTLALRPAKRHGAPPVLDLDALLQTAPAKRKEKFEQESDRKPGKLDAGLKSATSVNDLLALLQPLQDVRATPHPVTPGGWILVPSEERRKSGSHYTPRSLTGPIVRKALEPLFLQLGDRPTPEQILDLKICDPAMGSGAFLVETCRQLAEHLVESWKFHACMPAIPADEDELLYAQRMIAQRCLYGVDRNPMAVDLAKLSLWLATLAKDHPFTFLDHSLRAGDSLVALSREQAVAFHWNRLESPGFWYSELDERIFKAQGNRLRILQGGDTMTPATKAEQLRRADAELGMVREAADLVLSAFFGGATAKEREALRTQYMLDWKSVRTDPILQKKILDRVDALRGSDHASFPANTAIRPFHWELEFPEVFFPNLADKSRDRRGFDAFVGNPPFAGKNTIASGNHPLYLDWLKTIHEGSHGNADLSAHFFRRCFTLLREGGAFGLIATNTIAQGDTRSTGLRAIRQSGGTIYNAIRRRKWPGEAAVVVSVVHVLKGAAPESLPVLLDERPVDKITPFLFHDGGDDNPATLLRNANKSFQGSIVLGMGFTFDDTTPEATPIAEMHRLIAHDPRNQERIFPYIGGEEVNDSPTHAHHRYVINFGDMPLCRTSQAARWAPEGGTGIVADDFEGPLAADWPDLLAIVEAKVKPKRLTDNRDSYKRFWWQFGEKRVDLNRALEGKERVLAIARVGQHGLFSQLGAGTVFSEQLIVLPVASPNRVTLLQSRIHETWARLLGSSMKDDLRYTPTDCFESFPFPEGWENNEDLERVGQAYHDFRASLMVRHNEGLTKTYNRFHDPEHDGSGVASIEPDQVVRDIEELRRLHSELDLAVLAAYGWTDIDPTPQFLLDHEVEEDEADAPKRGKGRKKPWRLRFPDAVRDEILARLLALNAEYAKEEEIEAQLARDRKMFAVSDSVAPKKGRKTKARTESQETLL